jgi:hypothetical protein
LVKHMPAFHDGFSVFIPPFFVAMWLTHTFVLFFLASYRFSYILLHANNTIKWSHTNTGTT